jgi:hypothetical protein
LIVLLFNYQSHSQTHFRLIHRNRVEDWAFQRFDSRRMPVPDPRMWNIAEEDGVNATVRH